MKFQQNLPLLKSFGLVICLVSFLRLLPDAVSESTTQGYTTIVGDALNEEHISRISMQWCGDGQVPAELTTSPTFQIFEERKNYSVVFTSGLVVCPPGVNSSELALNVTRPFRTQRPFHEYEFSATGYFRAGDHYYPHEGFCITKWTAETVKVRVCGKYETSYEENASPKWSYRECAINHPCLPKCCPMNKLWTLYVDSDTRRRPCQDRFENSKAINPILYNRKSEKSSTNRPVHYFRNRLSCGTFFAHEDNKIDEVYETFQTRFRFQEDGTLLFRTEDLTWVKVPVEHYCMDGVQINGSLVSRQNEEFLGEEKHFGIYMCDPAHQQEWMLQGRPYYSILYGAALLFSSMFLLLTFVVYWLLWKEQKIQGWITMSHSMTMFFMYCFLAANHFLEALVTSGMEAEKSFVCTASGILTHYFFLSNFCWLSVICFNLFWTFRCINVCNPRARHVGQYISYAVFGWGLPFVFVIVSVILDQMYYSDEPDNMTLVPMYGLSTCTMTVDALGPYMYYPVAFLLTFNLVFFSVTSYKLYEYNRSTTLARENLNKTKQLLQLFVKLFFVMGFTWILEFVSWLHSSDENTWYWAVTGVVNILQGVAIFIIYVCKRKVVTSLRNSFVSRTSRKSGRSFRIGSRETDTYGTSTSGGEQRKNIELKSLRKNQDS